MDIRRIILVMVLIATKMGANKRVTIKHCKGYLPIKDLGIRRSLDLIHMFYRLIIDRMLPLSHNLSKEHNLQFSNYRFILVK